MVRYTLDFYENKFKSDLQTYKDVYSFYLNEYNDEELANTMAFSSKQQYLKSKKEYTEALLEFIQDNDYGYDRLVRLAFISLHSDRKSANDLNLDCGGDDISLYFYLQQCPDEEFLKILMRARQWYHGDCLDLFGMYPCIVPEFNSEKPFSCAFADHLTDMEVNSD